MEVHYAQPADVNKVREQLAGIALKDALVQNFGSSHDVLIQVPLKQNTMGAKLSEHVVETLRQQDASVELRRVEFVGPQVGKDLVENGAMALLLVSMGIVGYLWMRFEWKFGLAAIIANLHDVVIILGFFAFFQWEFSLSVLAAVLAVLGYSVNESVVVFDRIRENFRKMRKTEVTEIIDNAITRTMSRTIITHVEHADDGDLHAVPRWRDAALLRPGADHRHPVQYLFLGAGRQPLADDVRRLARGLHQAGKDRS